MKTGRNSPCPCGSGIKYKKCCGQNPSTQISKNNAIATHEYLKYAWQHYQAKRYLSAENICKKVLKDDPFNTNALQILSGAYTAQGRYRIAKDVLRKAIVKDLHNAEIYAQIGQISKKQNNIKDAIFYFGKAIEERPDLAAAYINRANILGKIGEIPNAISDYKRALKYNPNLTLAWTNLLFILNCSPDYSEQQIFDLHKKFVSHFESRIKVKDIISHGNTRDPGRVIRIGYVSPDFREHSVSFFIASALALHNRQRFEIYGYYSNEYYDATTTRIKGYFDHWRDIHALSDTKAAELIKSDRIDILVDLSGYTALSRILVFAHKPAPIQITWLGYPNTTALSTMDYRITDPIADPLSTSDPFYTETLLRMPDTFLCYTPPSDSLAIEPLPFDRNGYITFGSFNNLSKINDNIIEVWSNILNSISNSRLLLKSFTLDDDWVKDKIIERFSRFKIPAHRLILRGIDMNMANHLQRYGHVDIALDTFPYNGTTTTCEALWMGVPVVSLSGESHRQRVGASILSTIGKHEWIAGTANEYISTACNLARNPRLLSHARLELRKSISVSPLTDSATFTKALENIYINIWGEWCKK